MFQPFSPSRSNLAALIAQGAKFIPVISEQKRPACAGWPDKATDDLETVMRWASRGNVGICLGHGGLIDIEYDDEQGREEFLELCDSNGIPLHTIRTPVWESARGCHHLFRLTDDLPPVAVAKIGAVEVRIGGRAAQSVLPPSIHPSGKLYRWVVGPQDCEVAAISLDAIQAHA